MEVTINQRRTHAVNTGFLTGVFGVSLFTSAALLFWVQPLIAKILLPFLGGAASVWNTCMVFFQAMLLAGYAYALFLSKRFSIKTQALIHVSLLLIGGLVLPFAVSSDRLASLPTGGSPIMWLLGTLFVVVGPPFFILSATAPLLQRWFSHSTHTSAHDPYFLYAVSNAGSMLALLAFPFVLEPTLPIRTQTKIWAIAYVVLVGSIVSCAFVLRDRSTKPTSTRVIEEGATDKLTNAQRFRWTLLAFIPSSLMLGVTTYIATDVASVPLVWIIPLALYLLTFILAFSSRQILNRSLASHLLPIVILGLGASIIFTPGISAWIPIVIHVGVFFLAAFISHRSLAESRPGVARLAEYYLWIAAGGVLGGIFNALLAPLLFSTPLEYPIVVVLACLMRPDQSTDDRRKKLWTMAFPVVVFVMTLGLSVLAPKLSLPPRLQNGVALFLPLVTVYFATIWRPALFGLALAAFLMGARPYLNASIRPIATERNFFGVWRVTTSDEEEFRRLWHGSTVHGIQFNDPARKCEATSYYSNEGPVGQIFEVFNAKGTLKSVSVTGLGAGSIGTYGTADQHFDFYEIDPAIVRIAADPRYFTFLSECSAAPYRILLGDARLRMREAADGKYGLVIMDAFSSDSVPAHLLTTEAFELYLSKLSADGLIAFHISNRYLNLEPLLSGVAQRMSLAGRIRIDKQRALVGHYPSIWVVLARNETSLGAIAHDERWRPLQGNVVWTDDFSNILSLLK